MGYCYTRSSCVFLLADGMGGHPKGEVAAQLALQTVAAMFQKEAQPELPDVHGFLNSAVMAAHRQILRYSIENNMMDSPRTTVVVAVMQAGTLSWIHCGDSRLYLERKGEMLARTRDHSFLEQRQGSVPTPSMAARINRNVLFTCLGSPAKPVVDIAGPFALQQGDKALLCSDGLWGSLSDADIVSLLASKPVDQSVPELVEKALRKAGSTSDNVTVIAMEWETPDGFESTRGSISTDTISEGVFASTVQAGWLNADIDDLDDAGIERSIAEINAAIRKSAAKKA